MVRRADDKQEEDSRPPRAMNQVSALSPTNESRTVSIRTQSSNFAHIAPRSLGSVGRCRCGSCSRPRPVRGRILPVHRSAALPVVPGNADACRARASSPMARAATVRSERNICLSERTVVPGHRHKIGPPKYRGLGNPPRRSYAVLAQRPAQVAAQALTLPWIPATWSRAESAWCPGPHGWHRSLGLRS
jgi:hypothetical protein